MTKEIEFSEFFKLLNEIKEGDESKQELIGLKITEFKTGEKAESFLQELAQNYLWIGLKELFEFVDSMDLSFIGNLTKEEWDDLAKKNNCDLPVYLANKMINYAKANKFVEKFSLKWKTSEREIEKHIMPMAAYITEGIIDVLE